MDNFFTGVNVKITPSTEHSNDTKRIKKWSARTMNRRCCDILKSTAIPCDSRHICNSFMERIITPSVRKNLLKSFK